MEEINLNDIFKYIKNYVVQITIIAAIVFIAGVTYSVYFKTPMYKSTSTIVIATPEGLTGTTSTDLTLNQKLVDTYKEIIKSRTVIEETIKELNLDTTYEVLNQSITVTSVANTEVIKISVENEKAGNAQEIVTELTKIFSEEVEDLYKIENIKILDKASTANDPHNINLVKDIAIYIVVGIALGIFAIFIKYYFDKSIKNVEQIENITGLPILGAIPVLTVKGGKYE